jgi:phospholipid/cholesterol/gamma-HCH transport system substrate-binding protein
MKNNMIETVLGGVVLLVAGVFVVFAYTNASLRTSTGYEVTARFDRVGDLKQGDDVKLAGIKIGSVTDQALDPKTYQAVITLTIEPHVKLPTDTAAEIASSGLLGGSVVSLNPGGSEKTIAPGGQITITQGAVNLMDLIGKAIFSAKGEVEAKPTPAATPAADPLQAPLPMPGAGK